MPHTIATFKMTGFEQLARELSEFPTKMQKKAIRKACVEGAKIVKAEAKLKVYSAPASYWSKRQEITGMKIKKTRYGKRTLGIQNLNNKELTGPPTLAGPMEKAKFDPGWVAKNIWIGRAKKRPLLTEIYRVFLGDAAWFGVFIEYGGNGLRPMPFIRPALWNNIKRVTEAMRWAINEWLAYEYAKSSNNILMVYMDRRGR